MLDRMDATFGFASPRDPGHNAVEALAAMRDGGSKALIALGGNLAVAMPDPQACFEAFRKLDLSVQVLTKFNRSCLLVAKETIILPCLGRTELDVQAGGPQSVTVEDSMSMVHASRGKLKPAAPTLKSEPAIVAGLARATLPGSRVDWEGLVADYDRIRDAIEAIFPDFHDYNARIRVPGGFRLTVGASQRQWGPSGKAHFLPHSVGAASERLLLTTVRSHDQYNTTIYGLNDRYRGISGRRDILFANGEDIAALGLAHGDRVDVESEPGRVLAGLTIVEHAISRGSLATYFPEANGLVPLDRHDPKSGTPAYKSIPVIVRRAG
jgi:molybdopterin-dependent oxidoreductase alpha subunit